MQLDREYILRMIKGRSAGAVVVEGSESGGGGGSVALGPLLTSLNSEAMPSAEGYLHWTGSAWAFDTPTGGDPVDLTPYALKTWVQDNFAYKSDLTGLLTKTQADGYYAPISFVKPYLPLAAGSSYPLTGSLYITGNSGITWVGGYGMLCFKPTGSWAGVTENQWGVGSHSAQGVIRSSLELKRYDGTYQYTIWDTSNFDPLNFIRKDGGTIIGELNVRTQLNIQSAAGANKISFDGTTPNIDIASGGQITFDVDSHIAHDATNDRLVIHGNNGLLIDSDTYVGSVASGNEVATKGFVTGQGYLKGVSVYGSALTPDANRVVNIPYAATNVPGVIKIGEGLRIEQGGDHLEVDTTAIATRTWADGRFLKLTGGTMTGNLIMNGNGIALVPNLNYPNIYYQNGQIIILGPAVHVQTDGQFLFNGDQVATQPWVTARLGSYLPLTGGTVNGNLNVKGTIQAQDSNGNNKVIIYGTTGNIRAEKVYIGGSTSGYEAATHNWVTSQGYQANVIETVKVAGTALTPTNKAVDIPAATSDGSTFGVVAIGTGFSFDDDRLCVDTSTFATRTWADGRYLPLTAGSSKPLTGDLWLNGNLVAGNPNNTTNDDSAKIAFYTNKNYPNISPYIQAIYENNYGRKRLSVFQKNVTDWDTPQVEVFTIKPNGSVGIGTTTPAHKLDVNGDAAVGTNLSVGGNADIVGDLNVVVELNVGDVTNGGLWLSDSELGVWSMSGTTRQDTTLMSFASSGVTLSGDMIVTGKMAVNASAFDGTNTKLQVGGNIAATGSITAKSNQGNVTLASGYVSATNLYITNIIFGSGSNDPKLYVSNGHLYFNQTMIV